jgi:type I restriction enzyme S subunit
VREDSLPSSWILTTLGDICTSPQYGYTTRASKLGDTLFLRTTDITSGNISWDTVPYCAENPDDPNKYLLRDGDIVISRAGSVGFSHLIQAPPKAVFASYLIRFRPFINRDFFAFFLKSPLYWHAISDSKVGIAVGNVNAQKLAAIELPLPPLAEQKRIVAKIEELFSELEAGEESLRLARRQLATYRQSLLKQAFEGKLTAKWREQNPDKLESPASLTATIGARSRNANFRAKEDHEIPSWAYRTLDELTESVTSGSRGWASYYAESGSVFIRAQNLNQDFLNLADIAYVRLPDSAEGKRTRVKYGDLLITITGANTTKAGWVSTKLDEAYVSQHVALCRPTSDALSPFLYRYIVAEAGGRKKLTTDAYGAGKPGLNLDNVRSLTVPLPSLPEQQEIVRLLDEQFEVIERNEREIDAALQRSEALRQSILHRAFTGKLVPQDPADEPATELLARLRAERAADLSRKSTAKPSRRRK